MNKFEKSAKKGDELMVKILNSLNIQVEPQTKDRFCHYDGIATLPNGSKVMIETKERYNNKYNDYVLEYKKLMNMKQDCLDLDIKAIWYLNTFSNENKAIIWKINNALLKTVDKTVLKCNKTTAIQTAKINKVVYMLPVSKGFMVDY